jgi:hypothetical protein
MCNGKTNSKMNDQPLDQNIASLTSDIEGYKAHCSHWWSFNSRWRIILLIGSILFSAAATIAGAWNLGYMAATLSALGGAIIAAQNGFKFSDESRFYGRAVTECERLIQKLKFQTKVAADFDGVLDAFHTLRNQENTAQSQQAPQMRTAT